MGSILDIIYNIIIVIIIYLYNIGMGMREVYRHETRVAFDKIRFTEKHYIFIVVCALKRQRRR